MGARVSRASAGRAAPGGWELESLRGRFVEIGGGAASAGLTVCGRLVAEAQRAGGLTAWAGLTESCFFPPDWAAAGVDLESLAVVRTGDARQVWRVCDTLLRSGGFTLIAADVPGGIALPFSVQTRLAGLAQHHHAALIAITRDARGAEPRGSLVSLRAETDKRRAGHDCFACAARVVKDKRRPPGWTHEELCRGADGLC